MKRTAARREGQGGQGRKGDEGWVDLERTTHIKLSRDAVLVLLRAGVEGLQLCLFGSMDRT